MRIDGILLLDKPQGFSSHQALQRAKHALRADKAGHTGSLDPLATGMLPLCFGEATKIAGLLLGSRKAYRARVQLGVATNTCDSEGEAIATAPVPPLDDAALAVHLARFKGRIAQRAPEYCALKRDGVPLYKLARRGEVVDAPVREVEIHRIDVIERAHDWIDVEIECGSGTYIRSFARDLGAAVGCGAHLSALRRLWVEPFRDAAMVALDAVAPDRLMPIDAALVGLPRIDLDAPESARMIHGNPAVRPHLDWAGPCRVYADDGRLVALGEREPSGAVRCVRGFKA
jgi:tRNA pseudouridine55 synthase